MPALALVLFFLQAVDYSGQGMKALEENKYEDAVQAFRKAIEADPKDYTDHFNLALAYGFLHRDTEGIAEYRKTLELKPGLYEAQLNLGILLMRGKDPVDALPLFEAAAAQKPELFIPVYYLAEAQLQTGALDKAEQTFQQAIQLNAKSAGSELGLAHALSGQGKLDDSQPHFRRAGELEPKYRDYLLELAGLYEQAKQPAQAIAIYREFPGNAAAQEHLGQLMLENKEYADAIPRLEAAYTKDATQANRTALAAAYLFAGQTEKAVPLLDQAVASEPGNYDLRMMYARALRDRKQFRPSAVQFYEAAKLKPAEPKTWGELGTMLYMMGDYPTALTAFDKARQLGENTAGVWFMRAIMLDKLKQFKPAMEAYEQFLSMSAGSHSDQEFQARQRIRILKRELEKR